MSEKNHKLSRRQFLAQSAQTTLALTAFDIVFDSLLAGATRPALAAGSGLTRFVHLNLFGAPPRWVFDLILNPSGKVSDFKPNGSVKNLYVGTSSYTGVGDYKVVQHPKSGIYVPYLLSQSVPTMKGDVPAWNLLDNMMQIRGINVINAGHDGANTFHQAGVPGARTISSITADNAVTSSTDQIRNSMKAVAINTRSGDVFNSATGLSQFAFSVGSGGSNYLQTMFNSLRPISTSTGFAAGFINNKNALADKVNTALHSMDPAAQEYYKTVLESQKNSTKILTDESITVFSNLTAEWTDLYGKYLSLVQKVLAGTYAQINDRRIGATPTSAAEKERYAWRQDVYALNSDDKGMDLRTIFATADGTQMAAQFAVVEFLLTRGISPSIRFSPSGFDKLLIGDLKTSMIFDQHNVGVMTGLGLNSMYYLCLTSCLLELIDVLKAKNIFNETLIYFNSEFDRSPRTDGSGADHGARGSHVNLISGRLSNFKVVGNILTNGAGKDSGYGLDYEGTWGHGAALLNTDGSSQPLTIVQVWASVMHLMGAAISDLPNAVNKKNLLFTTPGSFELAKAYANQFKNIENGPR